MADPQHHQGDLLSCWDEKSRPGDVLVVTTNVTRTTMSGKKLPVGSYGVMGKGVALAAAMRFPGLPAWWSRAVRDGASKGWHCSSIELPEGRRVGCLVTKRNWWELSTVEMVGFGLLSLREWVDASAPTQTVFMTLPGAGNGRMPREKSVHLCRKFLDERFTICEV